jgi:hypothetical protein
VNSLFRGLRVPLLLSATLLICVTVHEIGHALATLATGGRVKEFSVLGFRPHIIKSVAGTGTFLAVWTLFIVSLPRGRSRFFEVKAATAFFAFIEVLGWTLASLQYPRGPRSDDPWKFLSLTGLSPEIVTITCIAMMGLIWGLYRSRTCPVPVAA